MTSDRDIVELACTKSYGEYDVGEILNVNDNSYEVIGLYNESNGYQYGLDAMLVKNEFDEYSLIFTGSDKRDDFFNDWVLNNGSIAIKETPAQYELGLELVNALENQGFTLTKIGGVSLGGGISGYIGINRDDLNVVSINPAPQVKAYQGEFSNIKVLIDSNDILFTVTSIANRKDYVPGTIYTFTRGNSFKEITLNHKGDLSGDFRTLDDSMPFDLLTNNLEHNTIAFNAADVNLLNSTLNERFTNYRQEYETQVFNRLSETVLDNIDGVKLENIFVKIIDEIDLYLYSCFPTLRSYLDFSYIFDEIKSQSHLISNSIIVEMLEDLINNSNITQFKERVVADCSDGINNFNKIEQFFTSSTNHMDKLVKRFVDVDNCRKTSGVSTLDSTNLSVKKATVSLSYFKYFDEAKYFLDEYIINIVSKKFITLDTAIDTYLFPIKAMVSTVNEIVGIISQELQTKVEICKRIVDEFYNFDIGTFVGNLLLILCDQIINLVIPIEIDEIVNKLKYLAGIINNLDISHINYISYLNDLKGISFRKLYKYNDKFNIEMKNYNSYLQSTYV